MNAPSGASASLLMAVVLGSLAHSTPGLAQNEVHPDWRTVFIDRLSVDFRVGNQAKGSQNCIGWACRGALLGEPVHRAGADLPSAGSIVSQARRQSRDPDHTTGMEQGATALREMQAIQGYRMLPSSAAIWDWLNKRGPVAAAIYWDELMSLHRGSLRSVPVNEGSVRTQGGHAITILGWSPSRRSFYFTPNLGREWGRKGFAFIREEDLQSVLINAVGFVHEGTDQSRSSGEITVEPTARNSSVTDSLSSAAARQDLLREALSRVDAVSVSVRRTGNGALSKR